jgi:putative peptidoglycan lipid II flippase
MPRKTKLFLPGHFTASKLVVPVLLAIGILATLGREVVFARYFGDGIEIEIFRLAFALPNILAQSLAPAVLGVVIPMLVKAQQAGGSCRDLLVRKLLVLNLLTALALSAVAILTVPWQASLIAPGFTEAEHASLVSQMRLLWIFFLGMSLTFALRAVLNERDCFWPGSSTSAVIAASFAIGTTALAWQGGSVTATSLSFLGIFAATMVFLMHLSRWPIQLRSLCAATPADCSQPVASMSILVPIVFVAIHHLIWAAPRLIDRAVATGTAFPQGTVPALDYSFNILTVPAIMLGTSFITIAYPSFVRKVVSKVRLGEFRPYIYSFLLVFLVSLGLGFLLYWNAPTVVRLIYVRGLFDAEAAQTTSLILKWQSLGLGATVGSFILAQAMLGLDGLKLLLVADVVRVTAKIVAVKLLVPVYGTAGLAASFMVPEVVTMLVLIIFIWLLARNRVSLDR